MKTLYKPGISPAWKYHVPEGHVGKPGCVGISASPRGHALNRQVSQVGARVPPSSSRRDRAGFLVPSFKETKSQDG